jgi:transposase
MKRLTSVGVDVAKAELEIVVRPSGTRWSVANTAAGHTTLVDGLQPLRPEVIVLEATGGYERDVAAALAAAGLPVVIVNPRQVRHFAKALGQRAKSDPIDAEVLALFGERMQPEVRPLPDEATQELAALLLRRRQLGDMLVAEKNRLGLARKAVRKSLKKHIAYLERELKITESELQAQIEASDVWRARDEILQSVPAVGPITARSLAGELPELGKVRDKEVAALVGVAPFADDSGSVHGKRAIAGGRASVRKVLYMATLVATRHNVVIRTFYLRLLAKGKPKKVAIVACMRKLLIILNAMVRDGRKWDETLALTQR